MLPKEDGRAGRYSGFLVDCWLMHARPVVLSSFPSVHPMVRPRTEKSMSAFHAAAHLVARPTVPLWLVRYNRTAPGNVLPL